jgi:hypothetical protein
MKPSQIQAEKCARTDTRQIFLKICQLSADRNNKMNDYTRPNLLVFGLAITIALFIGMQMMRANSAKAEPQTGYTQLR